MNKNVLIGLVVIALAAGGYYQFSYKPAQEAAMQAAADAAAAAEKAAAEAQAAADQAAADAKAAEEKAVADAAAAAAAATTAATTAMGDVAALLDPANFDAAKINAMIDGATMLDDATKATLKSAVDAAAADPAKIADAIASVKSALGL